MDITHDVSVLVTDGRKALLLRNEGDARFSNLKLVQKWEQRLKADREMKTDGPGRSCSSHDGGRRSSYSEANYHDAAERQFLLELGNALQEQVSSGDLKEFVIIAPPRALGELRAHLGKGLRDMVVGEIDKDLVKHPIVEIERLLAQYAGASVTA
jgi:protein required for attachment to host cells